MNTFFELPPDFVAEIKRVTDADDKYPYDVAGVVRSHETATEAYAACPKWFAFSSGSTQVMVYDHGVADFFEFVRARFEDASTAAPSAMWPSDMASAFMSLVATFFDLVPDESKADALVCVLTVLSSAANAKVFESYPMNTIFAQAFKAMFERLVAKWQAKGEVVRDALYEAYKTLLVVSTTTQKTSFDFLLYGTACFPVGFSRLECFDMRTYEARYEECSRALVAKFCK